MRKSLAWLLLAGMAGAQAAKPAPRITIDQLVRIKHPSGAQWTPDGSHVTFAWDDGGVTDTCVVSADGHGQPVTLSSGGRGVNGFWSSDGKFLYVQRNGLMALPVTGGAPQPAWAQAARGSGFLVSPDGTRVAYIVGQGTGGGRGGRGAAPAPQTPAPSGAQLFVHSFATDSDTSLAQVAGTLAAVSWSPDGKRLAYAVNAGGADLFVVDAAGGAPPAPVAHSDAAVATTAWSPDGQMLSLSSNSGAGGGTGPISHNVSPPEVGNKLIFVITENGGRGGGATVAVVPVAGGTPTPVAGVGGGGRGGSGWGDSAHLLATRTSADGKTRTSEAIDIHTGAALILHQETEDKFFSQVNTTSGISPDHRWMMYTSDATGWDEVYVVSTSGGTPIQVSRGNGEHWRAVWSHDSRRLAWDTNTEARPGDRTIEIATLGDDPARATIAAVTTGDGVNTSPEWSPDDRRILYQHTDARNPADLYVADARAGAAPVRLTHSMPADLDTSQLVAPQLVHYPGPDGKPVPAWLFVPRNLDRSKRHAALVWAHPDGVNMNYDGWHPDRNEAVYYEFHQYLLQEGYVVIAPDYRGSIGYGRDWRNDVYMDVGGNDAKDARLAATYLKTLGYVDPARIGIWGLSYGGFFVLQAVTQEPTWFRAAVDVAGVTDYHLYYEDPYHGSWTTSRIGTPEEHPDVYARADPMAHVDQLQTPLLVLAGTADVNVPFLESTLLIDALLKAGKGNLTTFMMYPGEFHYFDRSFVVRDAWQRVDAFFGRELQPERATAPR